MTCVVPNFLDDMSKILVVPDQQEAFVNENGGISVIFEVLEYQDVPDEGAAEFFFKDLSEANSALSSRILESGVKGAGDSSSTTHTTTLLKGEFEVKKSSATPDRVLVRLAVVRVPEHRADIVISMNEKIDEARVAAAPSGNDPPSLDDVFRTIIESFHIADYSIFS